MALPEQVSLQISCHFDATSVGFGAFGLQSEPKLRGQPQDIQHHARIMVSLVQQLHSEIRPIHVHAHDGCPFNEGVDAIAGACRRGWQPTHKAELRSHRLRTHPLREWAWLEMKDHPEIPGIQKLLQNPNPKTELAWPDRTLEKLNQSVNRQRWVMSLKVATVNVGTMHYQDENHTACSFKARELARQFHDAGLDIVGLQETRARESCASRIGPFLRLIAAGTKGQAGVELWIHTENFMRKTGTPLREEQDVCVWQSDHRCLAATVTSDVLELDLIVCYAPQAGKADSEIRLWWQSFREVLRKRPSKSPMLWMGDWNCRIGSVVTEQIGDHHADEEDTGGQEMRQTCSKFDMFVPSTMAEWHQGDSWTYRSPLGARSRIDFIAVQSDLFRGVTSSRIDDSVDVMNGDHDHRVVTLDVQLEQVSHMHAYLSREVPYDRDKARKNKMDGAIDLFAKIPTCPWDMDVNVHWANVRDQLQDLACQHFPKPKRQCRQLYFSDEVWTKVCQRKDLRQLHRKQQRDKDFAIMSTLFQCWKQKRESTSTERANDHLCRMQMALTLQARQKVDGDFRKCKRQQWKQWVLQQTESKLSQLEGASNTQLYKILQPKRMVAKSHRHLKRSLPGLQSDGDAWAVGRRQIALAWQNQFAAIENAESTTMEDLLKRSVADCDQISLDDLTQIPSVYQVEDSLRQMNDRKAAGLDSAGAELFQIKPAETAKRIYPILLKSTVRRQTTPELTGGWLLPLHKGKGSKTQMKGFRGVMLEPVMARIFSRSWRPRLEKALNTTACLMQWGGRKGLATEALHMQTRMWVSSAKAAKLTLSIIYVDIKSAFYAIAKQLLVGCVHPEIEVEHIAGKLGVPESARDAFADNMQNTRAVYTATGSLLLESTVRNMLQDTWFAVPCGESVMKPATGSRPGDPVADQLFGLIMGHFLQVVNERLQEAGIWKAMPDTNQVAPMNVTWVDDTAFGIMTAGEDIIRITMEALAIICDTAAEFGMSLSVGVSKTAVMFSYHGRGSVATRQRNEKAFPTELPILTEHSGLVRIPITNQYKLGGIVTRGGSLMTEVKVRAAATWSKINPLRKILQNQEVDLPKRQMLMKSMGLSVAMVHAGSWHGMNLGEYQIWQGLIHRLYSLLQPVQGGQEYQHIDSYELARDADGMMPMELLHVARLRLFVQILTAQDPFMYSAILCNFECAGSQSWLAGLQASCKWLSEQIDGASLPESLDNLGSYDAWTQLAPHARFLKKKIAQAQVNHKSRIRTLCDLRRQGRRQQELMTFMGHSLPESTDMPLRTTVTCSQCDFEAKDHAALAVHQSKRHGARIAMRRMLCDSVCRACGVQYHTRPRALQHLHAGTTRCWLWHMRAFEPMDDAQALELDEQDKTAKVAHHQTTIKSLTQDFHCRPATDQELQSNVLQPKEHGDPHWEDPTEQELQEWSAVGLLPPGQGGRQKTSRGQCQPRVKHVIADTQMFEARMLERATEWTLGTNSVPKPLTDGRKFALLLFAGHRREGDMAAWLEWQSDIIPLSVDLAVDAFHGDVCKSHLWEGLVRAGKVVAAHAAPPCETYTTARWLEQWKRCIWFCWSLLGAGVSRQNTPEGR